MVALLGGTTVVQHICLRMGLGEIERFGGRGKEGGKEWKKKDWGGGGVREKRE